MSIVFDANEIFVILMKLTSRIKFIPFESLLMKHKLRKLNEVLKNKNSYTAYHIFYSFLFNCLKFFEIIVEMYWF
jgi:hypothetical protein